MSESSPLWPGGPIYHAAGGDDFKICADSVLLAHFAGRVRGRVRRALELGCGSGLIMLLLCEADPALAVCGIELRADAAAAAADNLRQNGFEDRSRVTAGDLRDCRSLYAAGAFDLVLVNPPYFPEKAGAVSPALGTARTELTCTLSDVCEAASWLCRFGGAFCMVHRPERLPEIFSVLKGNGLEPKRLRPVQPKADAAPCLVLIEARRGGRPGLQMEAPLILCKSDGTDSDECRRLYHLDVKEADT